MIGSGNQDCIAVQLHTCKDGGWDFGAKRLVIPSQLWQLSNPGRPCSWRLRSDPHGLSLQSYKPSSKTAALEESLLYYLVGEITGDFGFLSTLIDEGIDKIMSHHPFVVV